MLSAILGSMPVFLSPFHQLYYWPILLHFRLGNLCGCCFIYICPLIRNNGKKHPMDRAYTLLCFININLFVFLLLASPNLKHVQHSYRIGFCCSCWEPFRMLGDVSKTSSNILATSMSSVSPVKFLVK